LGLTARGLRRVGGLDRDHGITIVLAASVQGVVATFLVEGVLW
jgi:hypothetical protein